MLSSSPCQFMRNGSRGDFSLLSKCRVSIYCFFLYAVMLHEELHFGFDSACHWPYLTSVKAGTSCRSWAYTFHALPTSPITFQQMRRLIPCPSDLRNSPTSYHCDHDQTGSWLGTSSIHGPAKSTATGRYSPLYARTTSSSRTFLTNAQTSPALCACGQPDYVPITDGPKSMSTNRERYPRLPA